jgi:hypothetical protein
MNLTFTDNHVESLRSALLLHLMEVEQKSLPVEVEDDGGGSFTSVPIPEDL